MIKQQLKTTGRDYEKYWPYHLRAIKHTQPRGKVLARLTGISLAKRSKDKTGKEIAPFFGAKPLKDCKVLKD